VEDVFIVKEFSGAWRKLFEGKCAEWKVRWSWRKYTFSGRERVGLVGCKE